MPAPRSPHRRPATPPQLGASPRPPARTPRSSLRARRGGVCRVGGGGGGADKGRDPAWLHLCHQRARCVCAGSLGGTWWLLRACAATLAEVCPTNNPRAPRAARRRQAARRPPGCRRHLPSIYSRRPPAAPRPAAEYLGLSQDICEIKKLLNSRTPNYKAAMVSRVADHRVAELRVAEPPPLPALTGGAFSVREVR